MRFVVNPLALLVISADGETASGGQKDAGLNLHQSSLASHSRGVACVQSSLISVTSLSAAAAAVQCRFPPHCPVGSCKPPSHWSMVNCPPRPLTL